ncbi:hypothetical protein K0504_07390 [Neiella marina]|uniref:Uncharacterized protein n=1 Tax=Neiella holothuriorum TaxID=2870530 RepID=A0ABS7EEU9_9GAMM|nr:hypothetical protein [Neiella holothuriorum]MBW8190855.1 hypothetical protein [Neiella holothuriorum]
MISNRLIARLLGATFLLSATAAFSQQGEPVEPHQQLFARSVMYQSLTDVCIEQGHNSMLQSAYQQWLLRSQTPIQQGRESVATMAAAQGRTMDSVVKIFLHMVEQNWALLNEGERSLKCIELDKYLNDVDRAIPQTPIIAG